MNSILESDSSKYVHPPVKAVVCNINHNEPSDNIVSGENYNFSELKPLLAEEYPNEEIIKKHSVEYIDNEPKISERVNSVFWKDDKSAAVQFKESNFVFFNSGIYPTWKKLKPIISSSNTLVSKWSQAKTCRGLSLRYLNEIVVDEFDETGFDLSDYFNLTVSYLAEDEDFSFGELSYRAVSPAENYIETEIPLETYLEIIFSAKGLQPSDEDTPIMKIRMVVEFVYSPKSPFNMDFCEQMLENGHTCIKNIFEKIITQKTRDLFDSQENGDSNS